MQEVQVSLVAAVTVGCMIMTILGTSIAVIFAKKDKHVGAENAGTVLTILATSPFFLSLCYLLWRIVEQVGKTISL